MELTLIANSLIDYYPTIDIASCLQHNLSLTSALFYANSSVSIGYYIVLN